MKKKRSLAVKELIALTIISSFFFAFCLPTLINYLMAPKDKISFDIKQNIALAGKNYFEQEREKKTVYIEELIKKGYLNYDDYLKQNNCNVTLSTVSLTKNTDGQAKYFVDLYCGTDFSNLTLSY